MARLQSSATWRVCTTAISCMMVGRMIKTRYRRDPGRSTSVLFIDRSLLQSSINHQNNSLAKGNLSPYCSNTSAGCLQCALASRIQFFF